MPTAAMHIARTGLDYRARAHQVARLRIGHRGGELTLLLGRARQADADLVKDVLGEPGAVEARRARAAPDVGDAEVLHRDPDDAAVARVWSRCDHRLERCSERHGLRLLAAFAKAA